MSRRKQIKSKQQFDDGLVQEKSGDTIGALKLYQKASATDPANSHAWNRQMILYRRIKTREQEVDLIKTAISEYQKSADTKHQRWLEENQSKADSSRELAKVLGLLKPTGLPKSDDTIIEKWQTRLYLLKYRIRNARKKKTSAKKPTSKPAKKINSLPAMNKAKTAAIPRPARK